MTAFMKENVHYRYSSTWVQVLGYKVQVNPLTNTEETILYNKPYTTNKVTLDITNYSLFFNFGLSWDSNSEVSRCGYGVFSITPDTIHTWHSQSFPVGVTYNTVVSKLQFEFKPGPNLWIQKFIWSLNENNFTNEVA